MARMWYYSRNKQQQGPVSWEDLYRLAQSGEVGPADLVWQEGTADWLKASRVQGLIPAGRADEREDEPAPRRRSRRDEDTDYDRPRRREEDLRRKSRAPAGSSKGLVIGLVAGGIGLLVVIALVVIIVVANSGRKDVPLVNMPGPALPGPVPPGGGFVAVPPGGGRVENFHHHLGDGQQGVTNLFLRAGESVNMRVDSTALGGGFGGEDPDVDLFVIDPTGRQVAVDQRIDRNCIVNFIARQSGNYRVEVDNLGPGRVASILTVTH